jgi:transcriptional/translational regulatory protein YebC/TACO1
MSGHSKWATTKHRKAAVDAKRSAQFSKLTRIITVAAKTGGDPNPENNASLAAAITKAKSYSLPKDKIQTATTRRSRRGRGRELRGGCLRRLALPAPHSTSRPHR